MGEMSELYRVIREARKEKRAGKEAATRALESEKIREGIRKDFDAVFKELHGLEARPLRELFRGVNAPIKGSDRSFFTVEFEGKDVVKFISRGNGFKMRIKWLPRPTICGNIQFKGKPSTSSLISLIVIGHLKNVLAEEQGEKKRAGRGAAVALGDSHRSRYTGQPGSPDEYWPNRGR